jgi:hypothetical protein
MCRGMRKVNHQAEPCHGRLICTKLLLAGNSKRSYVKKVTAILSFFIYLNSALGIGIDIHLCGGSVADMQVVGLGHAHCKCRPGSMHPGCCKNVICFCKTDNHRPAASTAISVPRLSIPAPEIFPGLISPLPLAADCQVAGIVRTRNRDIYSLTEDLYVLNCIFRI